jgi:uncharacterized cupredoxin-like copper-binding protein
MVQPRWRFLTALEGLLLVMALVLTACGGTTSPATSPSATSLAPITVKMVLTDFKIESDLTQFSRGVPYHFVIVNNGATEHELMIAPPMTQGMTMENIDSVKLFEVSDIAAGETRFLDFTFKESAAPGTLEFACHEPGHYEAGMKLPVVIV